VLPGQEGDVLPRRGFGRESFARAGSSARSARSPAVEVAAGNPTGERGADRSRVEVLGASVCGSGARAPRELPAGAAAREW